VDAERRQELKRERFKRVAQRRTQRVLRAMRLLANCGNRASYSYSEADAKKIFDALEREMERTRLRFADSREDFSLD
jgi:hypothetical protein